MSCLAVQMFIELQNFFGTGQLTHRSPFPGQPLLVVFISLNRDASSSVEKMTEYRDTIIEKIRARDLSPDVSGLQNAVGC